jgi:serine/threonine protein kinase
LLSGAFGHAVLYKRHIDAHLVVIKEVQLAELEATERQLALNEVQVLASLSHPNIIRQVVMIVFINAVFVAL